jgi:predicted Fe-Mo cluster-binding NifX family protein
LKIAVSSEDLNLEARIAERFGISPYLIIVDPETKEFEALPNPGSAGQLAAGVKTVVLAISREVDAVLTGYLSPTAMKYLTNYGIEVITGVEGTVDEAVALYKNQINPANIHRRVKTERTGATLIRAFNSAGKQLANLLPILVGVILLMGLFNSFIPKEYLSSIFPGNVLLNTLIGTGFGSILAGNPINSYLIGNQLLEQGVSLFAVTAIISAWVTIGLVQLPAEMAALGKKFALIRNALSFALCTIISILTVVTYYVLVTI